MLSAIIDQALTDAKVDGATVAAGFVVAVLVIRTAPLMIAAAGAKVSQAAQAGRDAALSAFRTSGLGMALTTDLPTISSNVARSTGGTDWHSGLGALSADQLSVTDTQNTAPVDRDQLPALDLADAAPPDAPELVDGLDFQLSDDDIHAIVADLDAQDLRDMGINPTSLCDACNLGLPCAEHDPEWAAYVRES